jgi:hypothetical protein
MQKLRGLILASALLCAAGAQAFQLNAPHAPTIHRNPQPLPPEMRQFLTSKSSSLDFGRATLDLARQSQGAGGVQ